MNGHIFSDLESLIIAFLASILILIMFAGLLVVWLIDGKIKKEQALHAFISSIVAWTITQMIKSFIPVARPYQVNDLKPLTLTFSQVSNDSSFPSSHAAVAFSIAVTVWLHDKRTGTIFLIMAIGVAIGRVLANVHFSVDVLVGALFGILVGLAIDGKHVMSLISNKKRKR
jgi:undecaprenyl-diphosphatase